jgi:hypothetical protein
MSSVHSKYSGKVMSSCLHRTKFVAIFLFNVTLQREDEMTGIHWNLKVPLGVGTMGHKHRLLKLFHNAADVYIWHGTSCLNRWFNVNALLNRGS